MFATNCDVCKRTKFTRARCGIKAKRRIDAIAPSSKFGDLITADHKVLTVDSDALIVQNDFTNWIERCPMRKEETSETVNRLQIFLPPEQKPGRIFTDNSNELVEVCQKLQWNYDTNTPHRSGTKGVTERAVRRVKEATPTALIQSGLKEMWCDELLLLLAECAR